VKQTGDLAVPLHIRNGVTTLMKNMQYGTDYQYDHSHENNFAKQEFLPNEIANTTLYEPGKNAKEEEIRRFLKVRWEEKYGY